MNWRIVLVTSLITIAVVLIYRFDLWPSRPGRMDDVVPSPSPTLEQLAENGWMTGCVKHTLEEARKLTDVVDEQAATAKASLFCACDWSYMRDSMGLSLEDRVSIGQGGSRGSSAIVEAQNYCYERYKGQYYP
ncbi:MAG: hypothetical protein UX62_C0039G0003 [Microgenomates group bacterium GW2011_GWA2_46_7]|nr:MAG: hypothetical protein UX62_C0039G0003 [Microgenomates group bacterium GW2011_GWA2_46_7]KKU46346.1 MAG: hypothetical protein UX64_C0008G0009 [Microgenomates group bacterium GW2011_GWC2_46_7]